MEDKQLICDRLLLTLQATRNLFDLENLTYLEKHEKYGECVIATFTNGGYKVANVAMDSGTSMIKDILKQII